MISQFWFHGLHNCFITVAECDLFLPLSLTKRLVNHTRPSDITEGDLFEGCGSLGALINPAPMAALPVPRSSIRTCPSRASGFRTRSLGLL